MRMEGFFQTPTKTLGPANNHKKSVSNQQILQQGNAPTIIFLWTTYNGKYHGTPQYHLKCHFNHIKTLGLSDIR